MLDFFIAFMFSVAVVAMSAGLIILVASIWDLFFRGQYEVYITVKDTSFKDKEFYT